MTSAPRGVERDLTATQHFLYSKTPAEGSRRAGTVGSLDPPFQGRASLQGEADRLGGEAKAPLVPVDVPVPVEIEPPRPPPEGPGEVRHRSGAGEELL